MEKVKFIERKGMRRGKEEEEIVLEKCKTTESEVDSDLCVRKTSKEKPQGINFDYWDVSRNYGNGDEHTYWVVDIRT